MKLNIRPQSESISGRTGAALIDPGITAAESQARIQSLQATGDFASSLSANAEAISKAAKDKAANFQEKFQKSQDFSATSTGITKMNAGMQTALLDNESRSDFENSIRDYDVRVDQLTAELLKDPRHSEESRERAALQYDAMKSAGRIKLQGSVKKKQMAVNSTEFTVNYNLEIENDATADDLVNFATEAFNNNVIGKIERDRLIADAPRQVEYRETKLLIEANPEDAGFYLGTTNLPDKDKKDLQMFGDKKHKFIVDGANETTENMLADPDVSDQDKHEQIDLVEHLIGKRDAQLFRKQVDSELVTTTSEKNKAAMFSIELLREEGILSNDEAKEALVKMGGDITSKDQKQYLSITKDINGDVDDSRKDSVERRNTIRKAGHKALVEYQKQNFFFDQTIKKGKNRTKVESAKRLQELLGDVPEVGEDKGGLPFFGPEFSESEVAELNLQAREAFALEEAERQKVFLDANTSFNAWLNRHPDATPAEADSFMRETLRLPMQQLSIRRALLNTR